MSLIIYKHELPQRAGFSPIRLPMDTKFLYVGKQNGRYYVWTLQDNFKMEKEYVFLHWMTGRTIERNDWNFIGTIQETDEGNDYVAHFFWR